MKTAENIRESLQNDRNAFFAHRREIAANLETLENLYAASSTPAQTVAAFVAAVGRPAALEIIGSLVNGCAWDGRISRAAAEWAKANPEAWDRDAAGMLEIRTDRIHRAHLDQIARAAAEYRPAEA